MAKKPIAVVRLVRKIGPMLIRILSTIASFLVYPRFIRASMEIKKCTESATAKVMIMVGAEAEGGVRAIPNHPAIPMAVTMEKAMTNTMPIREEMDLSNSNSIIKINRYMSGMRVCISCILASVKA